MADSTPAGRDLESSVEPRPHAGYDVTDAGPEAEIVALLEARGLSSLLRDFVAACVDEQPQDLLRFMRDWSSSQLPQDRRPGPEVQSSASPKVSPSFRLSPVEPARGLPAALSPASLGRANSGLLLPSQSPASRSQTPKSTGTRGESRARVVVVLAGERSNKEPLIALLQDAVSLGGTRGGDPQREEMWTTRAALEAAGLRRFWLGALETQGAGTTARTVAFVDIEDTALGDDALVALSKADTGLLVATASTAEADLRIKRQGELYNRATAAHSLGIRRLVVVVTDAKNVPATQRAALCAEFQAMATACGIEGPRLRTVFLPATADDIAAAVASLPPGLGARRAPDQARWVRSTGVVINGVGVATGDIARVFTAEPWAGRVEEAHPSHARAQHDEQSPRGLKLHQTGVVSLAVTGAKAIRVAVGGPLLLHKRGRILFVGTVLEASLDVP